VSDKFFGNVSALLGFDGTNNSTTFTDTTGKVWMARGNAKISTAQSKFGGASGLFDGSGDWIDTPNHADFAFGAGEFTLECWIRPTAITGGTFPGIISQRESLTSNHSFTWFYTTTTIGFVVNNNAFSINYSYSLQLNVWTHLALSKNGSTYRMYANGTLIGTTGSAPTINAATGVIRISAFDSGPFSGSYITGYIEELRVTKGLGRYLANFNVPRGPYNRSKTFGVLGEYSQPVISVAR
jgi:hypothetical protein